MNYQSFCRYVSSLRIFDLRVAALGVVLAFLFTAAVQLHSIVDRNADRWHADEWHTLMLGTHFLDPVNAAYTLRVGETTRWIVRLLYPLAIYHMNTRMGNDWELEYSGLPGTPGSPESSPYDGWLYPGGYYLKDNFNDNNAFMTDPNVQDYIMAMRLYFGIIAILAFSLVVWELFLRAGLIASAVYSIAILSSSLVFSRFSMFYSETTLFILINLAIFLFLRFDRPNATISAFSGMLSAAALSTKLTGGIIAAFMFFYIVRSDPKAGAHRVITYLVVTVTSLIAINWFVAGSYFDFVNETLINVYNYSGRHMTERTRVETISLMLEELGAPIVILFVFAILWLSIPPKRSNLPVYALSIVTVSIAWSLAGSSIYLSRNLAPLYVVMSFIVALGIGDASRYFVRGRASVRRFRYRGVAAVFAVSIVGFVVVDRESFSEARFFEEAAEGILDCSNIAILGLPRERAISATGRPDAAIFENFAGPYTSEGVPRWYRKYTDRECIIVKRKGQNKHISNYFAPITHDLSVRDGRFFFYKRKQQ